MFCVSTPKPRSGPSDGLTFFIDRDLGRISFPAGLRAAGLSVVTLAERYGVPHDQDVSDQEWMLDAAHHGWPVFGCDSQHRRRRRPAERAALIDNAVQTFILNGQVTAATNVDRVLDNLDVIIATCAKPGPFVYRIHPNRIERLDIDP